MTRDRRATDLDLWLGERAFVLPNVSSHEHTFWGGSRTLADGSWWVLADAPSRIMVRGSCARGASLADRLTRIIQVWYKICITSTPKGGDV